VILSCGPRHEHHLRGRSSGGQCDAAPPRRAKKQLPSRDGRAQPVTAPPYHERHEERNPIRLVGVESTLRRAPRTKIGIDSLASRHSFLSVCLTLLFIYFFRSLTSYRDGINYVTRFIFGAFASLAFPALPATPSVASLELLQRLTFIDAAPAFLSAAPHHQTGTRLECARTSKPLERNISLLLSPT